VSASTATGAAIGGAINHYAVNANSYNSWRENDLYHLINMTTKEIDKIGITSNLDRSRYSQAYLTANNVDYVVQQTFTGPLSRLQAAVTEYTELSFYFVKNGHLPRLNKVFR
jgi:hypothetical protein